MKGSLSCLSYFGQCRLAHLTVATEIQQQESPPVLQIAFGGLSFAELEVKSLAPCFVRGLAGASI